MEDNFAKLSIKDVSCEGNANTSDIRAAQMFASVHETTLKPAPRVRGFLDLPGELRNVIYRLICDELTHLPPRQSPGRTITNSIGIPSDVNNLRPLAVVGSHSQIGEELLTLLIFDNSDVTETAKELARYGPRSSNNLAYVPEFRISTETTVSILQCDAAAGERISSHQDRCAICIMKWRINVSVSSRYYVGEHIRLRGDDARNVKKHVRASFSLKIDSDYELTQESRSRIEVVFVKIFRINDDVSLQSLVVATDQIMALHLDALLITCRDDASAYHQVTFEFCRGARNDRPEVWMTSLRDAKVARNRDYERRIRECQWNLRQDGRSEMIGLSSY